MIVDASGRETASDVTPITERQHARIMAQNCTIGEANHIAHQHAVNAVNHLGNQIPGLIHSVVHAAIQGYHASLIELGVIPPATPIGEWVEPVIDGSVEAVRGVGVSETPAAPEVSNDPD